MNSGELGKLGERIFRQKMTDKGYGVQDVSGNPDYWYRDIDFLITSPYTGAIKSFEVKYDSRINRTGNMFLELECINSKGGKGWFEFTEADFIAYGDSESRTFYIIPLLELKERIKTLPQRIAHCGHESTGLLVSLGDIQDLIKII